MTCEQCKDKLSDLIEGDLLEDAEQAMRAHLQTCPDCRRELEQMQAIVSALNGLPEVDPPDGLRDRLRQIPRDTTPGPSWWQRSRKIAVTVTAAAAGLLLVWSGVFFYQRETGGVGGAMMAERAAAPREEAIGRRDAADEAAEEQPAAADLAPDETSPESEGPLASDATVSADEEARSGRSGRVLPTTSADRTASGSETAEPSAETSGSDGGQAPSVGNASRRAPVASAPPAPDSERTEPAPAAAEPPSMRTPAPEARTDQPRSMESEVADAPADSVEKSAPGGGVYAAPDQPTMTDGAEGAAGPAGPHGPTVMAERAAEPEAGTLPVEPPAYLDAGEGASARIGEGTPFTVGVTPPHAKTTGTIVPATIRIETEADVARARVTVTGSAYLDVVNAREDGVVFDGPLAAGQQTVLSVRMLAHRPGDASITMRVRSTDPVVDTRLTVGMGEFSEAVPPPERPVQFNFVGTPVREAVAEISRQSGMSVIVDPGVGEATVTARADDPVPAAAALRAVADAAGLQVTEADGATVVKGADHQ